MAHQQSGRSPCCGNSPLPCSPWQSRRSRGRDREAVLLAATATWRLFAPKAASGVSGQGAAVWGIPVRRHRVHGLHGYWEADRPMRSVPWPKGEAPPALGTKQICPRRAAGLRTCTTDRAEGSNPSQAPGGPRGTGMDSAGQSVHLVT